MNNRRKILKSALAAFFIFSISICGYSQLSGTKTIGGASPDYATITLAVTDVISQGVGAGGVTFNIRGTAGSPATYVEQLDITSITGASAANPVIFKSEANDRTAVIIDYSAAADNYVVRFNSCSYVTFQLVTIDNTSSATGIESYAVDFYLTANNNTLDNCHLETREVSSISYAEDYSVVHAYETTQSQSNNIVKNSTIKYGSHGIYFKCDQVPVWSGFEVTDNIIEDQYYTGSYLSDLQGPVFTGNTVTPNSTSYSSYKGVEFMDCDGDDLRCNGNTFNAASNAIYSAVHVNNTLGDNFEINNNTIQLVKSGDNGIYYGSASGGNNAQISGNTITLEASTNNYAINVLSGCTVTNMIINANEITGAGRYGIDMNANATAGNKGLISNNMIALNGTTAGNIDIGSSDYWNVYSNSLHYYGSTSSTNVKLLYMNTSADYTSVINNIFSNQCSGTYSICIKLDDDDTNDIDAMDNNDYFFAGTNMGYWDGVYKTSYGDWIAVSGETSSQNVDPKFTSDTDLRLVDATTTLDGLGTDLTPLVTDDIDGSARANPPTIGAYEVPAAGGPSITLTASFTTFTSTLSTPSASQSFTVEGTNLTADISVSVPAQFEISEDDAAWGSGPVTLTRSGGTVNTTTLYVRFNPSVTGQHTGDVSASSAGATTRNASVTGNCAMIGTYTVGGTTPDYASIADAVTDLTTVGISGAVILNLRTGTFTEQILLPAITGSSAANTITFQAESGTASDVIWEYNSPNSSNNWNIKLDGADYIILNKLTFNSLNNSYARLIDITNDATNNKVMYCDLTGYATTSFTSTNFSLIFSTGSTFRDNGNEFTYNTLTNGSYGIDLDGCATPPYETGTVISNNTFTNQSCSTIDIIYQDAPIMYRNTIITNSTRNDYEGIHVRYCDNSMMIRKNTITTTTANGYGIRTYECDGTAGNTAEMSNNMIIIGTTVNATNYCMYIQTAAYLNIYYNSLKANGTWASSGANNCFYHDGGLSAANKHNNIKNNIFMHSYADDDAWAVYIKEPAAVDALDYNNIYYNGNVIGKLDVTEYADLAAWKTATGMEANSISSDPLFVSATDLHIQASSPCIDKAVDLGDVTDDIDDEPRATDIGADEYSNPAPIELIYFTARPANDNVVLRWKTASEINNDYFTIEKCKDEACLTPNNNNWEIVDYVNGAGSSNTTISYKSTDYYPYMGRSYYRLKQTDFDGRYEYSDICAIDFSLSEGNILEIYPNPSYGGNCIIETYSDNIDNIEFKLFDITGKLLSPEITKINSAYSSIEINDLPAGVYFIKAIINSNEVLSKKLIIIR